MPFDPQALAQLGIGATGVLGIVASLFVSGKIVTGLLLDRAEKRAENAMALLADAIKDVNRQTDAVAALTTELREGRLRGQQ